MRVCVCAPLWVAALVTPPLVSLFSLSSSPPPEMAQSNESNERPTGAEAAVLLQSVEMPEDAVLIQGPDFNKKLSLSDLMASYRTMGFQASGLGEAIDIVEQMVSIYRLPLCD